MVTKYYFNVKENKSIIIFPHSDTNHENPHNTKLTTHSTSSIHHPQLVFGTFHNSHAKKQDEESRQETRCLFRGINSCSADSASADTFSRTLLKASWTRLPPFPSTVAIKNATFTLLPNVDISDLRTRTLRLLITCLKSDSRSASVRSRARL